MPAIVVNIITDVTTPTNAIRVTSVSGEDTVNIASGTWDGNNFSLAGGTDNVTVNGNLAQRAVSNVRNTDSSLLALLTSDNKIYPSAPGTGIPWIGLMVDTAVQDNCYVDIAGGLQRRVLREDFSAAIRNALNDNG